MRSDAQSPFAECFNLGNNVTVSIRSLAELINSIALDLGMISSELPILEGAFQYTQGFDDSWNRIPDISRARDLLGYSPSISLDDGLRRTLQYYLDNNLKVELKEWLRVARA